MLVATKVNADRMTSRGVIPGKEGCSLESPVQGNLHAGFGGGGRETCRKARRSAPTLLPANDRPWAAFVSRPGLPALSAPACRP